MPTTHVAPDYDHLLHEIANVLWKSRKVVVFTGAGISTNSGIPDFRSENGLYSLIQAQFDAAQHQAAGSGGSDAADAPPGERPAKRRRIYPEASNLTSRQGSGLPPVPFPKLHRLAAKEEPVDQDEQEACRGEKLPSAAAASERSIQSASTSATFPLVRPTPSVGQVNDNSDGQSPRDLGPAEEATDSGVPFPSSPPSVFLGTPHHRARLRQLDDAPESSSPLSSPPPIAFDPYQASADCSSSSSQDCESSSSESEGPSSATTPMLSSQTSSVSARASLPVMKGRDLFDAQIWSCPLKTSVFYTFVSTLRDKVRNAQPTDSHRFVSVLRDSRKLVRCYTQNIDQLEERVGLSTSLSLGAGSRYRFSVRSGRTSGANKASAKGLDTADASQGRAGHGEEEQETACSGQGENRAGDPEIPAAPSTAVQSSHSTSDTESPPVVPPSSTTSAPAAAAAPPAPNRGVECVFLHGSLAELRCFVCARTASWDEETRFADTLAGRQPTCPHCVGATAAREERGKRALGVGKLRPDIVLYGEEHPHAHLISPLIQHDLSLGPDMLLILGTSLRVHGLKVLVKEFAKAVHDRGGKVVFVNFTKPPESVWADVIDYWVQWDCDAWVGDLQQRKPALWLPPGATLSEEAKPKTAKLSRRPTGSEAGQQKESAKRASSNVGRGPSVLPRTQEWENTDRPIESKISASGAPSDDAATQSVFPLLNAPPRRPAKVPKAPREPKLNPDAKRPASTREHKLNGAYLVWKIMGELKRITGENNPSSPHAAPVKTSLRPTVKRPRKSAPAVLKHDGIPAERELHMETRPSKNMLIVAGPASSPLLDGSASNSFLSGTKGEPLTVASNGSISAAVKSRRRKRAVAWRMVGGVETQVSLDGAAVEPETPRLFHTTAVFQPSSPPVPPSRRLPPPTPTTSRPRSPPLHHPRHNCILQPAREYPRLEIDVDAGFRETDRLIAQLHHESQQQQLHFASLSSSCPVSRPSTPPLRLPPLRLPSADDQTPPDGRPRLVALEPRLASPGPPAEISSNVGSPVSSRLPLGACGGASASTGVAARSSANPFSFADPLAGWLGYPPHWMDHHLPARGEEQQHPSAPGEQRPSDEYRPGQGRRRHLLQHGYHTEPGQELQRLQQQHQGQQQQLLHRGFATPRQGRTPGPVHEHHETEPGDTPGSGATSISKVTSSGSSWSPDEQLRKEQEAVLMLSALSGRQTY